MSVACIVADSIRAAMAAIVVMIFLVFMIFSFGLLSNLTVFSVAFFCILANLFA